MAMVVIGANETVLFQGDSITDAGRSAMPEFPLGWGYAYMAAAGFTARHPELGVKFVNRGISGNRVRDLAGRWQADALDLKPDWVSVLIGINDTWRRYDANDPTSVDSYKKDYEAILAKSAKAGTKLIVIEPFLLHVQKGQEKYREDLDPKIQAAREVAAQFQAIYLPMDGLFAAAAMKTGPVLWTEDGVHPTPAGHSFLARHWLQAVGVRVGH